MNATARPHRGRPRKLVPLVHKFSISVDPVTLPKAHARAAALAYTSFSAYVDWLVRNDLDHRPDHVETRTAGKSDARQVKPKGNFPKVSLSLDPARHNAACERARRLGYKHFSNYFVWLLQDDIVRRPNHVTVRSETPEVTAQS